MQFLDRPAVVHERRGQPVEQLGMRRRFAAQTEIARRAHQTGAEVVQPDAIDHDAGRQRIIGDRRSPRASSSRPLPWRNGWRLLAGHHFEKLPRHGRPGLFGLPRRKTCGVTGVGASMQDHRARRSGRCRRLPLIDLLLQGAQARRGTCDCPWTARPCASLRYFSTSALRFANSLSNAANSGVCSGCPISGKSFGSTELANTP